MSIFVTVVTPAYNKGKTIERTYQSLLKQTVFDFEWILINDGSTDNTLDIIDTFQTDKFSIRFINKENEGLNRTFNLGVRLSQGDLILRLDPDDYLIANAIETVIANAESVSTDNTLCALVFLTKFSSGNTVGYHPYSDSYRTNFIDYRVIDKAKGDRLEVVKKEVLLENPMPEIEGEKFCLESYMWQKIAEKYDAIYLPQAIYVREYNEESITANLVRILSENPIGAMLTYSQYIKILQQKKKEGANVNIEILKNGINYFRFGLHSRKTFHSIFRGLKFHVSSLCCIPGYLLYKIDCMNPHLVYDILFFIRRKRFLIIQNKVRKNK